MPLYDYRCTACDHEFEILQGINDEPLRECPDCHKPALKKKVSAPAFAFKGDGWYKDLYGKPAPKSESESSATKAETAKPKEDKAPKSGGEAKPKTD